MLIPGNEGRGPLFRASSNWTRFIMVMLIVSVFGTSMASANEALTVTAEEYSVWDGTRLFMAEGNVTVRYGDALITADSMRYDADTEFAMFSGNVVYLDDERELKGQQLAYDLNSGEAVFDDMDAVLYSDGVDGPMFVRGDRVTATADFVRIEDGRLTTCECDGDGPPAYHFSARELEIYPGDRIVVRGMTFHEHGIPLLYLPYMVLSLKENVSRFDVPQIGYSNRTGWYVKLTYNYVLQSGLYGALLLDYYQKLGPGGGVRHTYVDNDSGRGVIYLYGVGNGAGAADGTVAWERRWTLSPWTLDAKASYDFTAGPSGIERHELKSGASVRHRDEAGTLAADVDYRAVVGSDYLERLDLNGEMRRRLSDDWSVSLAGEWFDERRYDRAPRRWLGYTGELRRATDLYTLTMRVEQQVNPDLKDEDRTGQPSWLHVSRLPEIELRLRRMAGIDLQLSAVRLQEEPSKVSALRGEAQAALATRTWRLGSAASVNVSGSGRARTYSTGHQQLTLQSRAGLNVQLARPLSVNVQYNYRDVWGDTPFRFDRVSPQESVTARLNWRTSALTASISTNYNFLTERWGRVTANATLRPASSLILRASGSYNLEQHALERIVGTIDWRPADDWSIRLGGRYHVQREEWERLDVDVQGALGGGWKAGVTAIYDVTKMSFSRNHMYIAHDEECREIRLRWDQARGEVWLEYHITAFPSSRVAVGAGEGNQLLFEADVLSEFL